MVTTTQTAVAVAAIILLTIGAAVAMVFPPGPAPSDETPVEPTVEFTLRTNFGSEFPFYYFTGVGGDIDGEVNPTLTVQVGDVVKITIVNGDGLEHDFNIDGLDASHMIEEEHHEDDGHQHEQEFVHAGPVTSEGMTAEVIFTVDDVEDYEYFCSIAGHREAGMEGQFRVLETGNGDGTPGATGMDIRKDPTDLPPPITRDTPATVRLTLVTMEMEGEIADGVTYPTWTYNGTIPGPFLRVREGDTVELTIQNMDNSTQPHSIDLHAVNGPGGGSVLTQTQPGESKTFRFKALNPGLYVYHCATPHIPTHLSHGLYGLILVEPEEGLPPVDREFYVMQSEFYTTGDTGEQGHQEHSTPKAEAEEPTYVVFNGRVGSLTGDSALEAEVGETVRIFVGNAGVNLVSSFHVIGEIFDRVYIQASIASDPLESVQTTLVPAGGAAVVEFKVDVPGNYILVDHSLYRLDKGALGILVATGPEDPDIYSPVE